MVHAAARDAFQVFDWIMSRHVHEYLDVAGRPVGEGRAAAFKNVHTEMQSCPYAGSRYHHSKPMNVTALRQMMPAWDKVVTMLSWLSQRYRVRYEKEITTYEDLSLVTSAGVFLVDFLVLRQQKPLGSNEIPVLISSLYKVCLGFQLATYLGSMQERFGEGTTTPLPNPAGFYDYLESRELLIGEAEVCSGSAAMIIQAYDAMTGRHEVAPDALPHECTRLEINWENYDLFTHHCSNLWNDMVLYVMEASQLCPELTELPLPPDVQQRLNASLKQRWTQLLAGQRGLVVDIARSTQEACGHALAPHSEPPTVVPGPQPNSLATTVVSWLGNTDGADMKTYAPIVANALQAQLAPYDLCESTVLVAVNEHLRFLTQSVGLPSPTSALTAAALSHVCGRTPRDWADPSW